VESGNDFVIQLKNNCPKLRSSVSDFIEGRKPKSKYNTEDNSKGRIDLRDYEIYDLQDYKCKDGWNYIRSVTRVHRYGVRDNKIYNNESLYISSKLMTAKQISEGIRGHWKIENLLHREKDVVQKEDCNYIKEKKLARNVSVLQTLAISIIRLFEGKSVKFANEKYANKIKQTFSLINNKLHI